MYCINVRTSKDADYFQYFPSHNLFLQLAIWNCLQAAKISGPLPKTLDTLFLPATYFSARKRSAMMSYLKNKDWGLENEGERLQLPKP